MTYNKPWKPFEEQLQILESRGMNSGYREQSISYLERVGYYRLSAYWYPFREFNIQQDETTREIYTTASDSFHDDTHFIDAVNLYLFDKKLRLILMDALERIEVSIKVDIAYLLGNIDTFAYLNKNNFHPKFSSKKFDGKEVFDIWQEKYLSLLERSKEDFVPHYKDKYGDLPIWVAIELWDFGACSQLFSMMKVPHQESIAKKYGVNEFNVFSSWLRSLNYLRNLVAHHSRLWNRNVTLPPKLPKAGEIGWCKDFRGKNDLISRPFLLFAIVRHLVKIICPNTEWHIRLFDHLQNFPDCFSSKKRTIDDIGVPEDWSEWWIK